MDQIYFKCFLVGLLATIVIYIMSLKTIIYAICILGGIIISCTFAIIETLNKIFFNRNNNEKASANRDGK